MIQPNNGQVVSPTQNSEAAQGFTAERVLRTRPKTYRTVVQLLADPNWSAEQRHNSQIAEVQDCVGRRWGAHIGTRDAADVGISYE
jgi:hypothetical protein